MGHTEMLLAVEARCRRTPDLVGTVGQLSVPHGQINVIPGRCDFSLDVRSGNDAIRAAAVADILSSMEAIAQRLNQALAKVMQDPQVRSQLAAQVLEAAAPMSLSEAERFYQAESTGYREVARAIGLQPQ